MLCSGPLGPLSCLSPGLVLTDLRPCNRSSGPLGTGRCRPLARQSGALAAPATTGSCPATEATCNLYTVAWCKRSARCSTPSTSETAAHRCRSDTCGARGTTSSALVATRRSPAAVAPRMPQASCRLQPPAPTPARQAVVKARRPAASELPDLDSAPGRPRPARLTRRHRRPAPRWQRRTAPCGAAAAAAR